MISSPYYERSYRIQDSIRSIIRIGGICAFGYLLGVAVVNMTSLPVHILAVIGAGFLLLLFPISPARFLLAYLIGLPFLDSVIPFFTIDLSGVQFGPQILLRGGLIILLVIYWVISRRNPFKLKSTIPMFILLVLLLLSTLAGGSRTQMGLITLAKHAYWMLLLPTIADMVKHKQMKLETIYICIVVSTLGFIFVVLISPFLGMDLGSFYGVGDARGPYGPHSLALCLCMGFIVVQALCVGQHNKLYQSILLLAGAAIVISVVRTYARTGYTSLSTSLIVFTLLIWIYGKHELKLRLQRPVMGLTFILIIGVISLYGIIHSDALMERVRDFSSVETAGAGRTLIYKAAIERYADFSILRIMFGGGLGSTFSLMGLYVPHNDYLVLLLAGGLVGLFLYLWVLTSLCRELRAVAKGVYLPYIIAVSAMAVFIVATMTNPVIGYMSVMTYFCFLVGGALGYYSEQKHMQGSRQTLEVCAPTVIEDNRQDKISHPQQNRNTGILNN